jgi:putative SOS response-associated peptidase YedK
MCLDIAFYSALELIDEYFPDLVHDSEFNFDMDLGVHVMALGHKRYPVIVFENGRYMRRYFEWGIIAEYMDTPEKIKIYRKNMVNARSEKILDDKKSFWHRIRKKRCLIPVTGIYEHREVSGWKNKIPYHVSLKQRPLFCIPGLYHYNERIPSDPETGEMRGMFSLITTGANEVMRGIHNGGDNAFRMPLFLTKEMELQWLKQDLTDDEMRSILTYQIPSNAINYSTVFSIRGKQLRPDGKRKNEPFIFEGLPELGKDTTGNAQTELF